MEDFPRFELFEDPVKEKSFEKSDQTCDACGRARGWVYTRRPYMAGPGNDDAAICPWCIADGSAAAKFRCSFNTMYGRDGSPRPPAEDYELVEKRTPNFTTWQDHGWETCCGRACVYLGEAGPGDLLPGGKWEAAAATMFDPALQYSKEDERQVLEAIGHGDPAGYVYRCRVCGGLGGVWDCS